MKRMRCGDGSRRGKQRSRNEGWSRSGWNDDSARRRVRRAFQWVAREERSGVAGIRSSSAVGEIKCEGNLEVLSEKRVVEASETVNVSHHACWAMENLKEASCRSSWAQQRI